MKMRETSRAVDKKLLDNNIRFRDEVGQYLAQGIGVGFTDEMDAVTKEMQKAIPTSFDVETAINTKSATDIDKESASMQTVVDLLKVIANKDTNMYVDGKQLSNVVSRNLGLQF